MFRGRRRGTSADDVTSSDPVEASKPPSGVAKDRKKRVRSPQPAKKSSPVVHIPTLMLLVVVL